MKPLCSIFYSGAILLGLLFFPAIASADTYEVRMRQIDPAGETIEVVCVVDKKTDCTKTLQMPISINGNEPRNVEVTVTLDTQKMLQAEFVLGNRYPLSVIGAYYTPFRRPWPMEAVKVDTVGLYALTRREDERSFPSPAVWKGPVIQVATIEIEASKRPNK